VTNRIVSGLSSGVLLVLLGQQLGLSEFAELQVHFTYGALMYWISDFGLMGLAYVHSVQSNMSGLASCWRMRICMLSAPLILLITILSLQIVSLTFGLIIFIGLIEAYVDSNLPIRQLFRTPRANNLSVTFRKISQLILMALIVLVFEDLTLNHVALIYGLPSGMVFIADSIFFRKYPGNPSLAMLKTSAKYFVQSSGTSISSIDLLIIDKFGFSNMIYPYALGKKIYSFLMIPGTTFLRISMKNSTSVNENFRSFLRSLKSILVITLLASLIASMLFTAFSAFTFDKKISVGGYIFILTMIFLPCLGAVSTNLNGLLVSSSNYRFAAISTFFSSFVYLLLLLVGFKLGVNEYIVLSIAICCNLLCEIWLEYRLIFTGMSKLKIFTVSFLEINKTLFREKK
jgi:hypothetical protein